MSELSVEQADNGWILKHHEKTIVVEDNEGDEDGVGVFAQLLWEINELIGPATSRHSKRRIHIDVKPGDKA